MNTLAVSPEGSVSNQRTYGRVSGLMFEYACHEGNYGLTGQLAGARAVERATNSPRGDREGDRASHSLVLPCLEDHRAKHDQGDDDQDDDFTHGLRDRHPLGEFLEPIQDHVDLGGEASPGSAWSAGNTINSRSPSGVMS